ncbi:Plasmid recombination enzyme [Roseivivax jejudonensis]|uniref:Plasmid recombination enzyme n=1 Tax=Roseivivax jejudonensis TaxID=1529041 RepID=A0A1X7A3V1_9RHOB|nr:plasmid recombination protein [Roseivivax jejudonensis]SLN69276.1 Plasmid recombination enzyme [Roseivivax jejudonensis]
MDDTTHPVVLRMQGLFPKDLGGYEGHRTRKGGDLGHVDRERSTLNRRLIGSEDWAKTVRTEIEDMALDNHTDDLKKLKTRRRKTEFRTRVAEGPKDPWRATRHGPLREIILTANRKWFEQPLAEGESEREEAGLGPVDIDSLLDEDDGPIAGRPLDSKERREKLFEARAVSWLRQHFGDDVVHARADLDEESYHIHAIIVPRATTKDGRRMLQPSKHPMIKDYEAAQDSVGQWFADIGLTRGERRAEAIREAIQHNAERRGDEPLKDVPLRRRHVSPRHWRRQQEVELADRDQELVSRETEVTGREAEATETLDIAASVAAGDLTDFELTDTDRAGTVPTRGSASRARSLFSAALARLRKRARDEAHAEVEDAFAEIRTEDDAIVDIARRLPGPDRARIAELRRSLTKPITRLQTWLRQRGRDRDRDEEK